MAAADYLPSAKRLRDHAELRFEQLIDLCGMDYSTYKDGAKHFGKRPRFAWCRHLLSVNKNWRLRLKVFAKRRFAGGDVHQRRLECGQLVRARGL